MLLEERLRLDGIAHVAIREPDPPWCGALMAIGFAPTADRRALRRYLARLPLLGDRVHAHEGESR